MERARASLISEQGFLARLVCGCPLITAFFEILTAFIPLEKGFAVFLSFYQSE